jgi:tyrosine-specific transport protein
VITSFLGVSVCLTDFLADGLRLEKKGKNNLLVYGLTFVPPLVIVLFLPNIFVQALTYAGIYCVVLLILLPAWMVWAGRYHRHIAGEYAVWGGKLLLALLIVFSVLVTLYGLIMG